MCALKNPRITIGITYYQASHTIESAVLSALKQSWDNTEIIVVNDGSNDGSEKLLNSLTLKYPSIQVIHLPTNKGVAAARNIIINNASGEFLAFFDDDDESLSTRIERQHQRITEYECSYGSSKPIICYTSRLQKYPDGQERIEPTIGINNCSTPQGHNIALRILTGKSNPNSFGSMATCSQMARLSTYKMLGGFDETFRRSEDTDFNVRAAIEGVHFLGIKDPLVVQKMTLTSDKTLEEEKLYSFKLLEKHKDFIKKYSHHPFNMGWLHAKYYFLEKKQLLFIVKMLQLFIRHPILTSQRLLWAIPNIGFNLRFTQFHNEKK